MPLIFLTDIKRSIQSQKSDGQLSVLLSYCMLFVFVMLVERAACGTQIQLCIPMGFGQFYY